jgi:spermidine/putrescine-binding protein
MKGQCSMHTRTRSRRSLLGSAVLVVILSLGGATACVSTVAAPPPTPTPLPLPDKLTFCDWAEDMPQSVLDAFEAEYGIKIDYQVYESQEQAIDRLKGGQRYDVVVMESRFIPMLVNDQLLASIDRQNIPNYKNISASFRNLLYDPVGAFHGCRPVGG